MKNYADLKWSFDTRESLGRYTKILSLGQIIVGIFVHGLQQTADRQFQQRQETVCSTFFEHSSEGYTEQHFARICKIIIVTKNSVKT